MPTFPSAAPRAVLAATAALLALTAGSASAAVTTSSVTAPADRTFPEYSYDLDVPLGGGFTPDPANQLTIAGTSNGTTGDTVDLGCQYTDVATSRWQPLVDNVPVAADGTFSAKTSKANLAYATQCVIRAIPGAIADNARATLPITGFSGPAVYGGYLETYYDNAHSNDRGAARRADAARVVDFYLGRTQTRGFFDYDAAASCGVEDSRPLDGSVAGDYVFQCADDFSANYNDQRNSIQVDGRPAFLPSDLRSSTDASAPATTWSRPADPATGDVTISETDPVVVCATAGQKPCTSFKDAGLRLERRITQDHDGRQSSVADSWVSTDGAAHKLDLISEEGLYGHDTQAFKASWEDTDYVERTYGDVYGAPPAGTPGTVYIDTNTAASATGATDSQGAVTYASQPSAFLFSNNSYYSVRYLKSVPAGGKVDIVQVYSQGATQADVQALASEATTKLTPAPVPPAAPQTATVTGPTVTVPGATPPAQVITVPAPQCVVPKLIGLTTAKAKAKLEAARCAVGKTRKRTAKKAKVGKVLSASKQAGGAWKVGTKVDLVVGKKAAKKKR